MQTKKIFLAIIALSFIFSITAKIRITYEDFEYTVSSIFKPESFYGKNTTWLNNQNLNDQSFFARHTFDMTFDVFYGMKTYGEKIAEFVFQLRNKGVWGKAESIASTTNTEIKFLSAVLGTHQHAIPRMFFWIRQGWLQFSINDAFNLPFKNLHTFTIGAFPFELGRGIALGDAYAVGPESLGFYCDGAVDQYAFGSKFSGELLPTKLVYDLYAAILQNNSSNLSDTSKKILGQEFGRLKNPERGFGKINFLMAARFYWNVFDNDWLGRLSFEPYGLYNHDPEQSVQFMADATSKLGTVGFATEFYGKNFEFGFDYAINLGYQRVKGWDRNAVVVRDRQGQVVLVNNHVVAVIDDQGDTEPVPYVAGSQAQNMINDSFRDQDQNGQEIGQVQSVGYLVRADGQPLILKNSRFRFRNPYKNVYGGWMFVADASYKVPYSCLKIAATVGVASGDDNPNLFTKDGTYDGFISLQEQYSGKRVRSVFLFGGAGKAKRFLSVPTPEQSPEPFAQTVSGFTNLVFTGSAVTWKPTTWTKPFDVNTNVLAYWQEKPIAHARTYLGVEWGTFINYSILQDLKLFGVTSFFFPGSHYTDRKGIPVETRAQLIDSNEDNVTGFNRNRIAELGDNIAYTFNMGLIYAF